MKDKIVEDLKREFDIRSCVGIDKYKTTLQDNNRYENNTNIQFLKRKYRTASKNENRVKTNRKKQNG